MKYIRTKDGIFKRYKNSTIIDNIFYYPDNGILPEYRREPILNQADTIEELCDEFVLVDTESKYCGILSKDKEIKFDKVNMGNAYGRKFYGAIWTDKGLIYVAKMNEKGELELL